MQYWLPGLTHLMSSTARTLGLWVKAKPQGEYAHTLKGANLAKYRNHVQEILSNAWNVYVTFYVSSEL